MTQPLSEQDQARYAWQITSPGFGEQGQQKLRDASVLISRCGGLGSVVAYELAAAGVGHLIIAHGGNIKPSDMNRQLLNLDEGIGHPRIESIEKKLREFNPHIKLTMIGENMSEANAPALVEQADVVVDAAPLFVERYAMNDEAVRQGKPMVECAMYDMEATCFTIMPGQGPCLRCVCPETPTWWKRQFPVFGATSGTIACMGAMEVIKILSGVGEPLVGRMAVVNLREMDLRIVNIPRDPNCPVCS